MEKFDKKRCVSLKLTLIPNMTILPFEASHPNKHVLVLQASSSQAIYLNYVFYKLAMLDMLILFGF